MIASPDSAIQLGDGESIETALILLGLVAMVELAGRFFCVIFFLIWLSRAYKNLPVLGARHLEFSPGWAVGWWFIPFANLVKPYQVVRELYSESDPANRDVASYGSQPPVSFELLGFWWGTFITFGIALRISDRMIDDAGDPSTYFPVVYLVGHILMTISAVLAIMIVRNVNRWQNEVITQTAASGQFEPPPPPPTFDGVGQQ